MILPCYADLDTVHLCGFVWISEHQKIDKVMIQLCLALVILIIKSVVHQSRHGHIEHTFIAFKWKAWKKTYAL